MDFNQLIRQATDVYDHFFWIQVVIWAVALIISAVFCIAVYGLMKQVCTALARFLDAKASVAEDEFRQRQVWETPSRPGHQVPQDADAKYRPKL